MSSTPTTGFRIRRATTNDAAALADLGRRTFADAFADSNTAENLAAYLASTYRPDLQHAELIDPAMCTLVAVDGEALIAFAQLRRGPPSPGVVDPTALEVKRFYVDRVAQGSGLAYQLMADCTAYARAQGALSLFLGVFEQNVRAIRFYERCGFVTVGAQVFRVGTDDQRDLVLSCPLTTSEPATA
jgi:diamine N-acetyltransferase